LKFDIYVKRRRRGLKEGSLQQTKLTDNNDKEMKTKVQKCYFVNAGKIVRLKKTRDDDDDDVIRLERIYCWMKMDKNK
jgi:hypothetical protein